MAKSESLEPIREVSQFHPQGVYRQGNVLIKETGEWALTVHTLLNHLEEQGFEASPRVVGSGFDEHGRETLSFIEGDFIDPGSWSLEACYEIGVLLRNLHCATASFRPPSNAVWRNWFGRQLGQPSVFGHCDFASWNVVARDGMPYALIDWDYAGPVDPCVELAQVCWLNAKLHDDIVAKLEGLPDVNVRASHLRAIIDGYGIAQKEREGFIENLLEFVVLATANEADEAKLNIDTPIAEIDQQVPWALAWRARSAAWIIKNKSILHKAITRVAT